MSRKRRLAVILILLVIAVAYLALRTPPLTPRDFTGGVPEMRPEVFFTGTTVSSGVVESRGGVPTHRFTVRGLGQVLPNGDFRLVQDIAFDHDAPTRRAWLMHRLDAHRYAGTLDGASGPVAMEAWGNMLRIRYPMASPPFGRMEQWIYLQPDGVTVMNEATVRILGIVVAHVSERITRLVPVAKP